MTTTPHLNPTPPPPSLPGEKKGKKSLAMEFMIPKACS